MALVEKKLDGHLQTILTEKRLEEAKRYFESAIKTTFNGLDPDCEDDFEVPLHGAPDIPECGLSAGYLKLNKYVSISCSR